MEFTIAGCGRRFAAPGGCGFRVEKGSLTKVSPRLARPAKAPEIKPVMKLTQFIRLVWWR